MWDSPVTLTLADVARAHLPVSGTVVDVGCGTGLMTRGRAGHRVGVDASAAMLARAERKQRIDVPVVAQVTATGLPSGAASAVLVCNVLHLHPDPRAVIDEALRICAADGRIFLCWPLDGPGTDDIRDLDLSLGRSVARAILANTLRRLVGITAALTRTARFPSAGIEQALADADGFGIVLDTVLLGCQRVVVLERHGVQTPARPNARNDVTQADFGGARIEPRNSAGRAVVRRDLPELRGGASPRSAAAFPARPLT